MIDRHYYRRRRQERREMAEKLLGSRCSHCGSKYELQFDHVDPATKEFSIANGLLKAKVKLLAEVKKCQLLCRKCHALKSVDDLGKEHRRHGSTTMYRLGCRCAPCSDAQSAYHRSWRKSDKAV